MLTSNTDFIIELTVKFFIDIPIYEGVLFKTGDLVCRYCSVFFVFHYWLQLTLLNCHSC